MHFHRVNSALVVLPVLLASTAVAITLASPAEGIAPITTYHAVSPTRILDTRNGTGVPTTVPVAAHGRVTFSVLGTAPASATSVVLNVTVTRTAAAGFISAYNGTGTPRISNLNFVKGQTVPNLVIAQVTNGKVTLYNGSAGTVALVADLSGYYATGAAGSTQGEFTAVTPTRLLDTRSKIGVSTTTPIPANKTVTFTVTGGANAVPSGVSAVALNVTATSPTSAGYLTAYAAGASRPGTSSLNFKARATVPNLAVVPVSSTGKVTLYNGSAGTVNAIADIQGYYLGGDPTTTGALGALAPVRLLAATTVPAAHTTSLTVAGKGGVPVAGDVSAVVLNVTVTAPAAGGYLTVYGSSKRPGVSTLNFSKGQTIANLTLVAPSASGVVTFYNGSGGSLKVLADVAGYVRSTSSTIPPTSTSRYVRNISDGGSTDQATMSAEGAADHASTMVVLDMGAQLNDKSGVQLSATSINVTYANLVTSLNSYLSGYANAGGTGTVAIATNNGADFSIYLAAARGTDWANKVIDAVTVPAGVTVVGANDIESGFSGTEAQAEQWITAYLGATSKTFLYVGSADGCPTTYGATGSCDYGWTQAQYAKLTHGLAPNRIAALPQIYVPAQAVQWANIAKTGNSSAALVGALTEHAACPTSTSPGCTFASFTPAQGWAALYHALSTVTASPALPYVSDLRIDA